MWEIMDEQSGKQFLSDRYVLLVDRSSLIISNKKIPDERTLSINKDDDIIESSGFTLKISRFDFSEINKKLPGHIAQLDYSKLEFPLKIRTWEIGDYFHPLGMKGKKKLSDFMIDIKIPLNLKRRIKVIESEGEIIWIVGYRIDERYKLTDKSKKVYQIEYFETNEESIQEIL
jgi:tRNA(Ile)-lysidine synthase